MRLLAALILLINFQTTLAGDKDCQTNRNFRELDKKLNPELQRPDLPKQLAPFDYTTPYGKIKSSDVFNELAGNYCDSSSNFPTIYASGSGLNAVLTVLGSGYEKTYPIKEYQKALNDYIKLLNKTGYKTK